jgi:lipoprotein-releasing system permease protein
VKIYSYLAQRYVFEKHDVPFINFITKITIAGIALGVLSLMLAFAVLRGFKAEVTQKIIGFDSHIRVTELYDSDATLSNELIQSILSVEGVKSITPVFRNELILKSKSMTEGVVFEWVPKETLARLTSISNNMQTNDTDNIDGLIIGEQLSLALDVELNEPLQIMKFDKNYSNPEILSFPIGGIYSSGMSDYDKAYIYSCDESVLAVLGFDRTKPKEFMIFLENESSLSDVMTHVEQMIPFSQMALSWKERHQTLYAWINTQQVPIISIIGLILCVAIFNITSTLFLIVMEKRQQIGLLKALGANRLTVIKIFSAEGIFVSGVGVILGISLALLISLLQNNFHFIPLPSDIYFMSSVPMIIEWSDILIVIISTLFISLIATLFPALGASNVLPSNSLRSD